MNNKCAYCVNILSSRSKPPKEPWDKVIHETNSFVVSPTVGSLVEGWNLIISKRHVPAMGALTEAELSELNDLVINVRDVTSSIYGSVVVFEHGPACEGSTFGCGIDHAHFHVVPLRTTLAPLVEKELKSPVIWETVKDIRDLSIIHLEKKSYLYILENDRDEAIVACLRNIPSQLMRLVIAKFLGIPQVYDYKKYKFRNNVIATLEGLEAAYKERLCLVGSK